MITAKENPALDFETKPLPEDLLARLPSITPGRRIVDIRKARGIKQQIELRKKAGLASATCATIEMRDSIPSPRHLFDIAAVLQIDPLLIVVGQPWEEVSHELSDAEKIVYLRLRKGWTQKQLAEQLEKEGLVFKTNNLKRCRIAKWERGTAIPEPETREIIRRVLGDEMLFQETLSSSQKPAAQTIIPLLPAEPKPEQAPTALTTTDPEPSRQGQIDVKTYEALALADALEIIQLEEISKIDSQPSVLRIRLLTEELRQMGAEEEASVIETDLDKKLSTLRQKITASNQPSLQASDLEPEISNGERKKANRTIGSLLQQFPGKSILQILPLLLRNGYWITIEVAIERIEKHQMNKLTPEDRIYLEEAKEKLQKIKEKSP